MTTATHPGRRPRVAASHQPTPAPDAQRWSLDFHTVALVGVLLVVALVRLRLLGVPFERDEGEYAYFGNLILNGGVPYRDAYNMKLPGAYFMYSLIIAGFGSSPSGIHFGLLVVSLATTAALFAAFRTLFTPAIGLVAASVYGLTAMSPHVLGFAGHATHFITLFASLGLWVYSRFDRRPRAASAALTGLLFGLAFLMKQQAAPFMACVGLMIVLRHTMSRPRQWVTAAAHGTAYAIAALAPYAVVAAGIAAADGFDTFWFWTVTYARAYASSTGDASLAWASLTAAWVPMVCEYPVVWLAAGLGVGLIWRGRFHARQRVFILLFVAASMASVSPGFYFRSHYFVVLLPAVGLLAGISFEEIARYAGSAGAHWRPAIPVAAVVACAAAAMAMGRGYYFEDDGARISRAAYGGNPFVEAPEIGRYIASHTNADDRIAILGSEPEILVYAARRSATRFIYTYPLLETHPYNVAMQREMIADIEAAAPKYLVYCAMDGSWLAGPDSPRDIFTWFNAYAAANYELAGRVDVPLDGSAARFYWDAAAVRERPAQENSVYVLRRKGG